MIGLDDPLFWVAVVVLVGIVRGGLPARWRPLVFALATLFLFHQRPGWPIAACLVGLATYGYLAIATTRSTAGVVVHTLVMTALFVGSQYATWLLPGLPGVERILPLIGLPYLYLRFVHVLVEVGHGRLARPDFVTWIAYVLPFHQILAGPIQRFPDYATELAQPLGPLTGDEVVSALDRITNGFVKKTILAQLLLDVVGFRFESRGLATILEMDLFFIWLYLDFSGYMDIVVGVGRLLGWRIPENFDWPLFSRNIVVFWTKWHITLSEWVRDYVFNPINLALQRGPMRGRALSAGILSYLVAMITVGLWHRANVQFLLYGLLQGLAIAAFKSYEQRLKKRLGREGMKRYQASVPIRAVSTFLTFQYVAFASVVGLHPPAQVLQILSSLVGR